MGRGGKREGAGRPKMGKERRLVSLATPSTALVRMKRTLGLRDFSEVVDLALCALDRLAGDAEEQGAEGDAARERLETARRALAHRLELAREGAGIDS